MPSSYRYWRLNILGTVNGYSALCGEIAFLDGEGVNLCVGGVASASDEVPLISNPANAFDGDTETYWFMINESFPQWIQYAFPDPVAVCSLRISMPNDSWYLYNAPTSFQVQASDDGLAFVTVVEYLHESYWDSPGSREYFVQQPNLYKVLAKAGVGQSYVSSLCRVHRHDTGAVVGHGQLAADGGFTEISIGAYFGSCYVVVFDDDVMPARNALIYSHVMPVLAD